MKKDPSIPVCAMSRIYMYAGVNIQDAAVDVQLSEYARRNQLLLGLAKPALGRLLADMEVRSLHIRDRIIERNKPIETVYFPLSCVLSTVAMGASDETVEVATIGNEGMVGVATFLGITRVTTLETFCQVPGEALWLRARDFRAHLDRESRLREIMGAYTQALLTQISQSSACNRLHSAEERCARWLLMTHDRVGQENFELTQEFLAQMLGVRRATVSAIAAELQERGAIRYVRGNISILDRGELLERTCECYRLVLEEYQRLLPSAANGKKRD